MHQAPPSLEELRSLRRPLRDINREHKEKLSSLNRVAIFVTKHIGTMGFFIIMCTWTMGWISWNTLVVPEFRFDPYPAFVLWLFISNMIQILLMPLIMIGQNLQGRHAEKRAEADLEMNTKAEREIEAVLQHLENQSELILKILKHIEKTPS